MDKWWYWTLVIGSWAFAGRVLFATFRDLWRLTRGMKPLRIYIAGPYSQGNPEENTLRAMAEADKLLSAGYMPYCPHMSHYHHKVMPHDYETWMRLDFAYLAVCDVLIRLPGYSPGADREVAMAKKRGIPVYYSVAEFLEERGECSA